MSRKQVITGLAVLLGLVPIVLYFSLLSKYAINIPKWDDHGLRAFIQRTQAADTIGSYLNAFWRQHNEHRIVYNRLVSYADYKLTGRLNFVHLMWVGNLSLLILLVLWGKTLSRYKLAYFLLPVPFLIFNLSQWENMYWGLSSLQNFGVAVWAFCSIYFLSIRKNLGWALFFGVLTGMTSGNGLIIWPVGLVLLVLQGNRQHYTLWAVFGISFWIFYFLGYSQPDQPTHPVSNKILSMARAIVLFVGSVAEPVWPRKSMPIVFLFGGLVTLGTIGTGIQLVLKAIQKRLTEPDYFIGGMLAFIVGTTLMVSIGRIGFDEVLFLTSRYKIYSILLVSVLYLNLILSTRGMIRTVVFAGTLLLSVGIAVSSYPFFWDETNRLRNQLIGMQYDGGVPSPSATPVNDLAPVWYDSMADQLANPRLESLPEFQSSALDTKPDQAVIRVQNTENPKIFLQSYYLLKSASNSYLVPFEFNTTTRFLAFPSAKDYIQPESVTAFPLSSMQPGTYQILVVQPREMDSYSVYDTKKTLTVVPRPKAPALEQNW